MPLHSPIVKKSVKYNQHYCQLRLKFGGIFTTGRKKGGSLWLYGLSSPSELQRITVWQQCHHAQSFIMLLYSFFEWLLPHAV